MKKYVLLIILLLLISSSISSVCISCKNEYGNSNYFDYEGQFDNKIKNVHSSQILLSFFNLFFQKNHLIYNIYFDYLKEKYPIMQDQYFEITINNTSPLPIFDEINLPDYFSWKDFNDKDWTTPARNQAYPESCGSCWAFAAIAALESIIEIREGNPDLNPDLSEQYILSCLSSAGNCMGGSVEGALFYMMDTSDEGNNCNGIILESCFPYLADDSIPCSEKSDDWIDYLIPIKNWNQVDLGSDTARTREILKQWIMENGPVATNIYVNDLFTLWGSIFRGSNCFFPYIDAMDNVYNHCVIILGWRENPLCSRGGYWICKNSWGSNWGYDGFFNIAYGSLNVASEIQWVDYDPDSYDWLYEMVDIA